MTKKQIIQNLDQAYMKADLPQFNVGDTLRVHTRIIEGDKERIQMFTGTVIAKKGAGLSETFTLHRVAYGEGMERLFLLNSPRLSRIEILKEGDVRRSKLYYLRGTSGKKAKVKSKVPGAKRRNQENGSKGPETVANEEKVDLMEVSATTIEHENAKLNSENKNAHADENANRSSEPETEKADA